MTLPSAFDDGSFVLLYRQLLHFNEKSSIASKVVNQQMQLLSDRHVSIFWLLIAACSAWITAVVIYRRWLSPLSAFPGPFLASVTRLWYTYIMWAGLQHEVLPALHAKYGRFVRVAPDEIHVTDPAYLKPIYGAGSKWPKTDFFKVFQGDRKFDLVSERDHKIHAAHKKLVAQTYSMSSARKLESAIDVTLKTLMEKFDVRVGKPFDVSMWIQFWSFDTIGMMTFSKAFGFVEAEADWNQALWQIRSAMDSAAWLGQNPSFYAFCSKYVFPFTGNLFAISNRHGSIRKFAIEQAMERQMRDQTERPDIMRSLLAVHGQKPAFDTNALQSMVTTNIFGGAETTASSMRAALYYILKNPTCKAKLVEEIEHHCERAGIAHGSAIPFEVAEKMQYLQACIYEAMRLFPANGIPSGRVAPHEGLEIDGKRIPVGTQVTIFSWCLHRDQEVFGHEADTFHPERLLESDHSYYRFQQNFFSFGGGSRICLGRSLAWMEMTKGLATLFRRYDINLARPEGEWTVEGSFIKGQRDIDIVLQLRSKQAAR